MTSAYYSRSSGTSAYLVMFRYNIVVDTKIELKITVFKQERMYSGKKVHEGIYI